MRWRPIWLNQNWESRADAVDPVTSAGFLYEWGFPPRCISGVTPRAMPQIRIDVFASDSPSTPQRLVVLDYKPSVKFRVCIPFERLQGKEIELKNFINKKISAFLRRNKKRPELPLETYVCAVKFERPVPAGASQHSTIICLSIMRPEDTEGGTLSGIISDYATSKLVFSLSLKDVQLVNGVRGDFGRMNYLRSSAARSFLDDFGINFASYFAADTADVFTFSDENHAVVTHYVKMADLQILHIGSEQQKNFFTPEHSSAENFWEYAAE